MFILAVIAVFGIFLLPKLKKEEKTTKVEKAFIQKIIVSKSVSASGKVEAQNSASLSFPITGTLQGIYVKKGDGVKKGQILARLVGSDLYQDAVAARETRDYYIRDRDLFVENYETNMDGYGGKDEYAINLRKLTEQINRYEASYQSSLADLEKTYIRSPLDAVTVDTTGNEGETIVFGTEVAKVADLNNLIFKIELDQEDFSLVRAGTEAEITLDTYSDFTFKGTVIEMPLYADSTIEKTFAVRISLEQDQNRPILIGMSGDAQMTIEKTGMDVTALPFDCIYTDEDGKTFVWIDKNGKVAKKYIEIGLDGDLYTEIKTPIEEQIIIPQDKNSEIKEGYGIKYNNWSR